MQLLRRLYERTLIILSALFLGFISYVAITAGVSWLLDTWYPGKSLLEVVLAYDRRLTMVATSRHTIGVVVAWVIFVTHIFFS